MDWIYDSSDKLIETFFMVIILFFIVIAITRVIGLRSFAKFTTFDFAFTVAVGSIVAAILTSSTSVVQGSFAIFCLLALTAIVAYIQRHYDVVDKLISNKPLLLMDGETILEENMEAAYVSKEQLIAKLREANVLKMNQVKAVVLETTGDISVLHTSEGEDCDLEEALLLGVKREA